MAHVAVWRKTSLKILLRDWPLQSVARKHFNSSSECHVIEWRKSKSLELEDFKCDVIRNFSIIAHIDHGKSTLADRFLELTGTIKKKLSGKNEQVLDKLKVERERGITVKAQTASMIHSFCGKDHLLNLIDTPGHVDFSWEVSRSLAACQGALLLVDASQGVQAQSISVFHAAKERGLKIIPVLNKIDLPTAQPDRVVAEMRSTFGIDSVDVLCISAKTGTGVEDVLKAIVERIPPPVGTNDSPLKALLFDSLYDRYRGVISLVSIQDGVLRKGDKVVSCHTQKKYDIKELGIMHPEEVPTTCLQSGQVGYIACNMKEPSEAHIGDTLHRIGMSVDPMPGFKPTKAMVYAGVFPLDSNEFPKLEESIKKLTLTDRSVTVQRESSTALGQGCRLGFLGTLHMDVFRQRLEDEYDSNVIITAPTVPYKVVFPDRTLHIRNPTEFPEVTDISSKVKAVEEPIVKASIIVPEEYLGEMMDLCFSHRADNVEHRYLDAGMATSTRTILTCTLPLSEVVTDFFDQLKSRSSGFASFEYELSERDNGALMTFLLSYEDAGYKASDLAKVRFICLRNPVDSDVDIKMVFLLNGKVVDALAIIVHRSAQQSIGRSWVKKLRVSGLLDSCSRFPFRRCHSRLVRRYLTQKITALLNAYCTVPGHYERKLKHLVNQREGKQRLKRIGNVDLPQEAFFSLLSTKKS